MSGKRLLKAGNYAITVYKLGHASASFYLAKWAFNSGPDAENIIHKVHSNLYLLSDQKVQIQSTFTFL